MLVPLPDKTLYRVAQPLLEINATGIGFIKPEGHLLWPVSSEGHAPTLRHVLYPHFVIHEPPASSHDHGIVVIILVQFTTAYDLGNRCVQASRVDRPVELQTAIDRLAVQDQRAAVRRL